MAVTNVIRTVWEVITKQKGTNMNEWNRAAQRLQMTSKQLNGALQDIGVTTKTAQRSFLGLARRGNLGIEGLNSKLKESQLAMVNTGQHAGMIEDKLKGGFMGADKALKTIQGRTQRFQMQWLSIMFLMMALQRVFKGILQSALKLYTKVTENQTELAKKINGARAALTYMKFAIIDALGPLIKWVSELIIGFADWISMHPEATKWIAAFLALGAVVTTVALWIAILKLGVSGIGMAAFKAGETGAAGIGLLNPAALGVIAAIAVLIAFAIISFRQLSLVADATANGMAETFQGNSKKAWEHFDVAIEGMILAGQKFAFTIVQYWSLAASAIRILWTTLRNWIISKVIGVIIDAYASMVDKIASYLSLIPGTGKIVKGIHAVSNSIRGLKENVNDGITAITDFETGITKGIGSAAMDWAVEGIKNVEQETEKLENIYKIMDTGKVNGISTNVSSFKEAEELYNKLNIIPNLNLSAPFEEANPKINETADAISGVASSQERLNQAIAEGSSLNFGSMFGAGDTNTSAPVNQNITNNFDIKGDLMDTDFIQEKIREVVEEMWGTDAARTAVPNTS